MPETGTPFQAASEVVAQVAFQALLPMLTDTVSSAVEAELLEGSVLTNATPNTVSTSKSMLAVRAHLATGPLSATRAPLTMLAKLSATALITALAQLTVLTN